MIKYFLTMFSVITIVYLIISGIGTLTKPFMEWTFQFPTMIGCFVWLSPFIILISLILAYVLKKNE